MTDRASAMLERLRAVEWTGDWGDAAARVMSRRVLMREYLRRAGVWARTCSADTAWPFFDATEYLNSDLALSPGTEANSRDFLVRLTGDDAIKRTCAGAVHLAALRTQSTAIGADLPDLYEPLILFCERGGEFLRDNAGFIDLTGALMRPGTLQGSLGTPVLRSLDSAVLDAVDAKGRVTYYTAATDSGSTLLRQRVLQGERHNEAFSRDRLRWECTVPLPSAEDAAALGFWLDEMEAANLIAETLASNN
ncbi:hypothetical protein [Streptomyces sp. SID3915]|uniref:hypothetical protein n=1 Tax=Streptomyces sp. SID3915 TaxID=2690263 RepID=UPI00136B3FA7|nr:hypothetical protein [Streptomyces sp. SID3915]MYX72994.1 hypothetical protein [Streptomyces sp. SID3915]